MASFSRGVLEVIRWNWELWNPVGSCIEEELPFRKYLDSDKKGLLLRHSRAVWSQQHPTQKTGASDACQSAMNMSIDHMCFTFTLIYLHIHPTDNYAVTGSIHVKPPLYIDPYQSSSVQCFVNLVFITTTAQPFLPGLSRISGCSGH